METFHQLKGVLRAGGHNVAVGDEGGFAPNLDSNEQAIRLIMAAIEKAGYKPGKQIGLALDAAANEFCHKKKYVLTNEGKKAMDEYYITQGYYQKHVPRIDRSDSKKDSKNDKYSWSEHIGRMYSKKNPEEKNLFPIIKRHGYNIE